MYFIRKNAKIKCLLCPHECERGIGEAGKCLARIGVTDGIHLKGFGRITTLATEPIEKKPLFHFHPGLRVLSAGFYGCNMSCSYCQNWKVSQQNRHEDAKIILPMHLVDTAIAKDCKAVCFTYNEPTVYYEYIVATSFYAREKNLAVILKTNGMLNPQPWLDLLPHIDAFNIDWKGMDARMEQMCGVKYDIRPNIETALSKQKHIEISIPVYADSTLEEFEPLIDLLKSYPKVPVHLLKIYPAHLIQLADTTDDKLINKVREMFLQHLLYVYTGHNQNTICPTCAKVNVKRKGCQVIEQDYSFLCDGCLGHFKQMHG